jgi:thymidylate kinase
VAAHSVAQEHTIIPDLWKHQRPDLLVYLDVSYEEAARRREIFWDRERHERQKKFLTPAREAADLVIHTDGLPVSEVVGRILERLRQRGRR